MHFPVHWRILLAPPNCSAPRVGTPHSCGRYGPDAGCCRMNPAFRWQLQDAPPVHAAAASNFTFHDNVIFLQIYRMKTIYNRHYLRPPPLAMLSWLLTLPAWGATFSLNPSSDAFVTTGASASLSGNNYGGAGALSVAAANAPQGEFQSVLQFSLSGAKSSFDTQFGAG